MTAIPNAHRAADADLPGEVGIYATIGDVIEHYVLPTLGEFATDFDADAIAREVAEFVPDLQCYMISADGDNDFWDIVTAHETPTATE